MWHRPTDAAYVFVVDRAFVVSVMLLRGPDEWVNPRRIHIIGNQLLDDPHVVAIALPHTGYATFDRVNFLKRPHNFVVARRIKRNWRAARGNRTQNGHTLVPFVLPILVFLFILEERAYRDRNRSAAEARTADGKSPEAPGIR